MAIGKARSGSRRRPVTFDTVRELGLALAGVEEGTSYGAPALKVGGKMFACVPTNRSAEPHSLVLRLDFTDRDYLITSDPEVYYLTSHYVGYPCVLARLELIRRDALREALEISRDFVMAKRKRR
jgi:hypothetical protein